MLTSKPAPSELAQFRQQLAGELEKLKKAQKETERRLHDHEGRLQSLDVKDREHEETLRKLGARVDRLEGQEANRVEEPAGPFGEPPVRRRPEQQLTPSDRRPGREGVSLSVRVTGDSNTLEIGETHSSRGADSGSFEVSRSRSQVVLHLLGGTGGVVTVTGDGNTIHLSRHLCGRVRIVDRGRGNSREGCD